MTDFSREPIEGEEAAKFRKMHHEWELFQNGDRPALSKLALIVKYWASIVKFAAFSFIIGVAGNFKSVLDWLKGAL